MTTWSQMLQGTRGVLGHERGIGRTFAGAVAMFTVAAGFSYAMLSVADGATQPRRPVAPRALVPLDSPSHSQRLRAHAERIPLRRMFENSQYDVFAFP
jgi:hypothetical protein